MDTKVWKVDNRDNIEAYKEAASLLKQGEVVAFPTETVYGLGANALDDEAVRKIFQAKQRPADNPLIVHVASDGQWRTRVRAIPDYAEILIERFWPGPLTLILPMIDGALSPVVTAGLPTAGFRMPDHPAALRLIAEAGVPIAAPSANRSGKPSPTRAEHVLDDLYGRIAGILDGGSTGIGVESTVVDATGKRPVILRPGGYSIEQLREWVPVDEKRSVYARDDAVYGEEDSGAMPPRSPGMKYRHYSTEGELFVVYGTSEARIHYIKKQAAERQSAGQRVGILTFDENRNEYPAGEVLSLGPANDLTVAGRRLYDSLRLFDARGVQAIWAEAIPEEGVGVALMNRLLKAAGGRAIRLDT